MSNITDLIKFPVRFDKHGGYFWDAGENMIAQVRGWGRLSYLPDAEEKQDFIGEFIASAINRAHRVEELEKEVERLKGENEWKAIEKDGVPSDSKNYLVTDVDGNVFECGYDLCEGEWIVQYAHSYWKKHTGEIRAWRELPAPYEVKS